MIFDEYKIVEKYFKKKSYDLKDIIVNSGDDCAILSINKNKLLAYSTDSLVSDIHFFPDINPKDLGYKSIVVNLSDLAAMGAEPAWAMLSLTLPQLDDSWLTAYSDSFFEQLKLYNMQLIGGNTTLGSKLSITVTVCGFLPNNEHILTRSSARIGDLIYVTGTIGDSSAGLAILKNKLCINDKIDKKYLLNRHLRPQPRILHGQKLRNLANSAIDISDGIVYDLNCILIQSKCSAQINLDAIPRSKSLERHTTLNQFLNFALFGGEDYELCFTIPEKNKNALEYSFNQDPSVLCTCIGKITRLSKERIQFMYHNQPIKSSISDDFNFLTKNETL